MQEVLELEDGGEILDVAAAYVYAAAKKRAGAGGGEDELEREHRRYVCFFFSSRRRHTRLQGDWSSDVCSSDLSGGTVVSSALVLLDQIIRARYPSGDWNIYVAQASDGDNFGDDGSNCRNLLVEKILPLVRYFAYVQVVQEEQSLWQEYSQVLPLFSHRSEERRVGKEG